MQSVYLNADHEVFRDQVRRFLDKEIAPRADEYEQAGRLPREVFARMGELGFLGINIPEAYGGSEADIFYSMVFLEELPRGLLGGLCAAVSVQQYMATQHIFKWGSEDLKQRYLVPSVAGRMVGALAVTEPDTGSDVAAIRTRAVKDGDHYVINGAKTFITNGADGDFATVACKTNPEAGLGGISLIVVEHDTPGFRVAKRLKKMGWYCSDTAELSFEDVRVPASQLVGQENMGFYYIMECFQLERLVGAAIGVGSADIALEKALEYMAQRHAFGKPLTKYQALTHRLADLAAETEAARQLTYHAAWLLSQGAPCARECTMAKLLATELGKRAADHCLQCFGGYGFMEEYPLARFYRDARVGTIVAGTSEIMREILVRLMTGDVAYKPVADRGGEGKSRPAAKPASGTEQAAAQTPEDGPPLTVEGLMNSLPGRFRPEKLPDYAGVFHFHLAGADAPEWTVSMADGVCSATPGLEGEAVCLVEMDAETYLGIETGRVNPQAAFMSGKIKVSDIAQMMNYLKAFKPVGG